MTVSAKHITSKIGNEIVLHSTLFALYDGEVRFARAHTVPELHASRHKHPRNDL